MAVVPPDPALAAAFAAAQARDFPRAVDLLARALRNRPGDAALWFNRAVLLQQLARHEEALHDYDAALAVNPGDPDAWFNRGVACDALGRLEEAAQSYDRALALAPTHVGALCNRGVALAELGWREGALESFAKALAIRPNDVTALYNSGNALRALDRPEDALRAYERAIAINPRHADAWQNRGLALEMLERNGDALGSYREAIKRAGDAASLRLNCSAALIAQNQPWHALEEADAALALEPLSAAAQFAKSVALLTLGRYEEGFALYEQRWRVPDAPARPTCAAPLWLGGEDIADKSILLHGEQGFGDMVQFCRFAAPVAARGARVFLHIQPALKPLLAEGLRAPLAGVSGYDEPIPETDFHTPIMSLALACGARLEEIPNAPPYLDADPARVDAWRRRLGRDDRPLIGLVWRGDASTRSRARRSMSFETLAPALAGPVRFVSLQLALTGPEEERALAGAGVAHFADAIADFRDTAAIIANCDLVISVDTSVCHLAGALGRPVWIMLRHWADWRWLVDRDDSPWSPTARLFRQPAPGAWDEVVARIRAALDIWLRERPPRPVG